MMLVLTSERPPKTFLFFSFGKTCNLPVFLFLFLKVGVEGGWGWGGWIGGAGFEDCGYWLS